LASKRNDETVAGALVPSRLTVMGPQLVLMVARKVFPRAPSTSGGLVIFLGLVWTAGTGVHPGRRVGATVGAVDVGATDAVGSVLAAGSVVVGDGLAVTPGLAVSTLANHTKPMTTSTTATTAITGCLSRTGHAFLIAPRRRAE
jgi:hypothetical protein